MNNHPIFKPIKLWQKNLRNRTAVAPMSRVSSGEEGFATDEMADYYSSFARGGFSFIITEGLFIDEYASQSYKFQPGIATEQQLLSWKKTTQAVHQHDALIIAQLMHGGALSQLLENTLAPSSIQPKGNKLESYGGSGAFPLPKEMTLGDILKIKNGFVTSAMNAHRAGFDGIEIHGANGYLLDQFITPELNLRKDQYGGNLENRYRIIAEIITEIKNVVPENFIIGLRISEGKVNDLTYRWKKGIETAKELAKEIKKSEPDYIHVAVQTGDWERDSFYENQVSLASVMRSQTQIPVIANGGFHDLTKVKKALKENHADLFAIGKVALADPEWPLKTLNNIPSMPFHKDMLWPKATISHTKSIIEKLNLK